MTSSPATPIRLRQPATVIVLATAFVAMTSITSSSAFAENTVHWQAGPGGSLLLVEENPTLPIVTVTVAARTGAAADPEHLAGLSNMAGEVARRGAGGKTREQLDDALDDLGASLDVLADTESVRFVGRVLSKNFNPFMDLLADVILRPTFDQSEVNGTRREVVGQLAESRNDDRSLCARNFSRRLWGRHPYGQPADGTEASLKRMKKTVLQRHFKSQFSGSNVIFAATGDITTAAFSKALEARFDKLPNAPATTLKIPKASPPQGWRIQLVDKPDRQQVQMMFGQLGLPATHPDYVPLSIAMTAFGGHAMNATLMKEVRTERGWAYGAYMSVIPHRQVGALNGWVFTGVDHAVDTLRLVLRLYTELTQTPAPDEAVAFFKKFLAGAYASELDSPSARLWRRVLAEIQGLPRDWVDTFAQKVTDTSAADVRRAVVNHLKPHDLAITLVATADVLLPKLQAAGIDAAAVDVTAFTAF